MAEHVRVKTSPAVWPPDVNIDTVTSVGGVGLELGVKLTELRNVLSVIVESNVVLGISVAEAVGVGEMFTVEGNGSYIIKIIHVKFALLCPFLFALHIFTKPNAHSTW